MDRGHGDPGLQLRDDVIAVRLDRRPGHLPQPGIGQLREPLPRQLRPLAPRSPAAPPGTIPAASAAARYLRTVFRDSPRLPAISFFDRPACQCTKISQISITSNVLLAIGPPSLKDEGNDPDFPMTRSTPTRTP